MTDPTDTDTQPDPHKDKPGEAPGATPPPAETVAESRGDDENASHEPDEANRARGGSTYGFGTPAEGFGQRHDTTAPGGTAT